MHVLGLTGGVAMGKSRVTGLLRGLGVPVLDSDAVVHGLYAPGGAAVAGVVAALGVAPRADGGLDRSSLAARVLGDPEALALLERLVHGLVQGAQRRFLAAECRRGTPLVALDIPLLFETGGDRSVDAVVVVTANPEIQRQRVLGRPGMTPERFEAILGRQMPDAEKRRRADFVIDTGHGLEVAQTRVAEIVGMVLAPDWKPRPRPLPEAAERIH